MQLHMTTFSCHGNILHKNSGKTLQVLSVYNLCKYLASKLATYQYKFSKQNKLQQFGQ